MADHHRDHPSRSDGAAARATFRTLFAKPLPAAIFLTINGAILLGGERLRRQSEARADVAPAVPGGTGLVVTERRSLDSLAYREAGAIGLFQTLALFAGISRSGITMVAGLLRGLDHEDAARFSFLLATRSSSPPGF